VNVLVDTPIWSQLFRRKQGFGPQVDRLRQLIERQVAMIIGPVRQEALSGIRTDEQFQRVRDRLRAFPDHPLAERHYERAAEFFNICRTHGIQGSSTDFLICAVSELDDLQIYSTDDDFEGFAKYLPIKRLL
jgi:predicted nucleic acid-binding protein